MLFGAHIPSAGGILNIIPYAKEIEANCFQFFSRSPQGGPAPQWDKETIKTFKSELKKLDISQYYIHAPYYINLASSNNRIFYNSIKILREELERASIIGAQGIIFHIGSAKDLGEEKAIEKSIKGLNEIMKGYKGKAELLIENSAGAGKIIGDTFDEIAIIFKGIKSKKKGVCLDTAHAFGSGYDLTTPAAVKKTFKEFDNTIGLKNLRVIHCNDSAVPLGSHKDRHAEIGKGEIGKKGFKSILSYSPLKRIPFIIETPKAGYEDDLRNIKVLRSLANE